MIKVIASLIMLVIILSFPLAIIQSNMIYQSNNNTSTLHNTSLKKLSNITVAIVGKDIIKCKSLERILKTVGIRKVIICNNLSKLKDKDIDIIFLLDISKDKALLHRYLVKGVAVIVPEKLYKKLLLNMLKSTTMISILYSDTYSYGVKFIGKLHNGKYAVAIHGVAGKLICDSTITEFMKWYMKMKSIELEREHAKTHPMISEEVPSVSATSIPSGVRVYAVKYSRGIYSPYWVTVGYVSWSSGDMWRPYGRLNLEHEIKYLVNDGNPDMDWWAVRCTTQGIPGKKLYGSSFVLEDFFNYYYLKYYTDIYELRDYDPTSRINPVTVSVTLGKDVNVITSWTYPGDYIDWISDESDFYTDKAGWWHNIHASPATLKIDPGFEFTVSPPETGKQKWEISAQWGFRGFLVKTTVVIIITFQY